MANANTALVAQQRPLRASLPWRESWRDDSAALGQTRETWARTHRTFASRACGTAASLENPGPFLPLRFDPFTEPEHQNATLIFRLGAFR